MFLKWMDMNYKIVISTIVKSFNSAPSMNELISELPRTIETRFSDLFS